MNKLIKSNNILIQIFIIDSWYNIYCAKGGEFTVDQDEIEVTSVNSGSSREYMPGMMNATLSVNGISPIDNSEGIIAITYLQQQSVRQVIHQWRVFLTADDGSTIAAVFNGMIKTTTLSKEGFSYNGSSLLIRVSGGIDWTAPVDPPVPPQEFADYWSTTPGGITISGASVVHAYDLISATVLIAFREGLEYNLIETGTPVGRQCKHNSVSGTITFDANIIFNPNETVWVLFRK